MSEKLKLLKARLEYERKWLGGNPTTDAIGVYQRAAGKYIEALETTVAECRGRIIEMESDLAMRKIMPDAGKELPL